MIVDKRTFLSGSAALSFMPVSALRAEPLFKRGQLTDREAIPAARSVYTYLCDIWQQKTLTGQQESYWRGGPTHELDYIEKVTAKLPAVLGLDYLAPTENAGVNARAIDWYHKGGIVSICWHWGNPMIAPGYEASKIYFDVQAGLTEGTPENKAFMRDMNDIADLLTKLQNAGVPVLWRPFHEFTGDWFWWGKVGPTLFKKLWVFMYEYFTNVRGLHNLIWVLGYTASPAPDAAWYPGRQYVDIIGADTYVKDHGPLGDLYAQVLDIGGPDLPIALHECGPIPDPDFLKAAGADWLYFLTWHTSFIDDGKTNPPEFLRRVYQSEQYITRDELPTEWRS